MPSPNDPIANAIALTLGTPVVGSIAADDTLLPGEPNYFNANGSVWYSYAPGAAGPVTINVTGSEGWDADAAPDAGLIVFTGAAGATDLTGLQQVGNNLVTNDLQTTVSFNAAAGQTYYVQVTGGGLTTGSFNLAATPLNGAVITGFADDTPAPGDANGIATTDHDLTVTGLATPNSTVTLYNVESNGTLTAIPSATTTADANGLWNIATGTLADGDYRFAATATVGGVASDPSSLLVLTVEPDTSVDTTPPDAPVFALDPGSDTGVAGNGITADTTPTVTGTAEDGATITLYDTDGTTALGTAVATGGAWSITSAALAAGAHTLVATATDGAGNISTASGGLAISITAPRDMADFPASEPGFDRAFYLAQNQDVLQAGVDPLVHFQNAGWQEGRDPNAVFHTSYYLNQNPDVAAAGIDPLLHYLQSGAAEGRDPGIRFDSSAYLELNQDVAAAGLNPLVHYLMFGASEDRPTAGATPHPTGPQDPLVDATFYFNSYGDVAAAGIDPTAHYMQSGWQEGRDPNAFFDTSYYLATNEDVAAAGIDPLLHYEANGWREGRDPSEAFDTSYYLESNPDVAAAGIDPLVHYLAYGIAEERSPLAPA